jgi:hypothetical protein
MNTRRAISLLCLSGLCLSGLCLSGLCLTATTLSAQSQAARVLDQAKVLYGNGEKESASILFYRVLNLAQGNRQDNKVARSASKLLKIVDPVARLRTIGYKKAARGLIEQAKAYKQLKWFELAIHLAFESQDLDPTTAKAMLNGLGRAAPAAFRNARRMPKPGAAAQPKAKQTAGWKIFKPGRIASYGWKKDSGVYTVTPKLKAGALAIFDRRTSGRCAVSAEFRRASAAGSAALVFGARNYQDFYVVEVLLSMNQSEVRVLRWDPNKESVGLVQMGLAKLTRDARKDWVEIAVHIEANAYAVLVNGKEVFKVKTTTQPHGRVGYFVSAGASDPVSFRFPYVGPIEKKPPPTKQAPKKNPVLEALERIEKSIAENQKQKAVLGLFALQRKNVFVGDAKVGERIEELLGSACPEYAKLRAARNTAATALLDVAKRYEDAGWKRLAREVLLDAAVFSDTAAGRFRETNPKTR